MTDKLEMTRLRRALTALALSGGGALIAAASAHADRIDNGVAVFSALDKVTARTSKFEVPLNSTAQFGAAEGDAARLLLATAGRAAEDDVLRRGG